MHWILACHVYQAFANTTKVRDIQSFHLTHDVWYCIIDLISIIAFQSFCIPIRGLGHIWPFLGSVLVILFLLIHLFSSQQVILILKNCEFGSRNSFFFLKEKIICFGDRQRKRIIENKYLLSATDMDVVYDLVRSFDVLSTCA